MPALFGPYSLTMKTFKFSILFFFFITPLQAGQQQFVRTQILMENVPVSITVEASVKKREKAYQAMENVLHAAREIEHRVSEWRPESQATLLNRNAGRAFVPIGRDLMEILTEARRISELTQGAFDVTFASPDRRRTYRDIVLLPELGLAYLPKGTKIGVSSIAKGYLVDRMAQTISKHGFRRFLIDAGDLYASGPWEISIRNPDRPDSEGGICRIKVKNQAVSTSGNYERGSHIIDPKSRLPAHRLKSITVVSKRSVLSSPLATGLFVLGSRGHTDYRDILKHHPGAGIIRINQRGKLEVFGDVSGCR